MVPSLGQIDQAENYSYWIEIHENITLITHDYRLIKKKKKVQWNIENIVMITLKQLQMNQISALNDPLGVDIPLNKLTDSICELSISVC